MVKQNLFTLQRSVSPEVFCLQPSISHISCLITIVCLLGANYKQSSEFFCECVTGLPKKKHYQKLLENLWNGNSVSCFSAWTATLYICCLVMKMSSTRCELDYLTFNKKATQLLSVSCVFCISSVFIHFIYFILTAVFLCIFRTICCKLYVSNHKVQL